MDIFNDSDNESDAPDFLSLSSSDSEVSFLSATFVPLNENLNTMFANNLKHFNVVHINAQSIPAHYTDLLASFGGTCHVHAILVSESWLKPCLPSTSYSLPGFKLIRNDRVNRGGGGVAIYLRSDLAYTILSSSAQPPPPDSPEYLLVEVQLSLTSKILLGVCYCPSSQMDYFNVLERTLELHTPSYQHTIIMGDFNTCMAKDDSRSKKLNSVLDGCNLHLLPLNPTHIFPGCSPSLLDLIVVSSPNLVDKYGQCPAEIFSYHDLIYVSYNLRPPKPKKKVLLQRNFSDLNVDNLKIDAKNIDWAPVFDADHIDKKLSAFNTLLTQLYDKNAPIRPVKLKQLPAPWLTEDLKALIRQKHSAKAKFKRTNCSVLREKYIKIRNRCNKMCRDAQRRYIHSSVENGDPCKVWKFLRSLGVGKSAVDKSCPINANVLNKQFTGATSSLNPTQKARTLDHLANLPIPGSSSFVLSPVTAVDVKKHIASISSNAVGDDGISRKMIIPILDSITPVLVHIFNHSIDTCVFPSAWKDAYVIPLPKTSRSKLVSDFRPISVLPFLSKVLERLISHQLTNFVTENNILSTFQSGFRRGHSTTTALLKVSDDIRYGMDNKLLTMLALLDFSNAFNSVDHDILLSLLRSINISPAVVCLIRSYLTGRRQRVKLDDSFSDWDFISAGVPQGGVLSPLLFAIFINSITASTSLRSHLYADDFQVYTHTSLLNLRGTIGSFNRELELIYDWSRRHGLVVNPMKTQLIIIGSPGLVSRIDWNSLPPVRLNNVVIPFSKCVKNLGVYFDDTLSWSHHLKEISKKIYATWFSVCRLRYLLPIPTKIKIAESLFLSILDYADACLTNITEVQLNKLERLQNLAIRFIFGLKKFDHVSEFRTRLKWLPIRFRRDARILSLVYCIIYYPNLPLYLKEKFLFRQATVKELRSASNFHLEMPVHQTKYYGSSFVVTGIKLWNSLPKHIKLAKTLNAFKSLVKLHYLNICKNYS